MNIFNIAWKIIFSKKQSLYTTVTLFISILVSAISVATAISILGISRNYEDSIKSSISSIEPQITVTHLYSETLSTSTIDSLKEMLYSNDAGYLTFESIACEYLESHGMLKNKNKSIGVLVYAMPENCLHSIYDFIVPLPSNVKLRTYDHKDNTDFLYLSQTLYDDIGVNDSNEVYLFNLSKIVESSSLKALKAPITSLYNSKVNMFDKKVIFISIKQFRDLFNIDSNLYSGLMINKLESPNFIKIKEIENRFKIVFVDWKEKYYSLLEWLTIFSNPIKLIMIFILVLSSAYFIFSLLLLLYDKSDMIAKMRILGFSSMLVNRIILMVSIILFTTSIFIGISLSTSIEYLINTFDLIKLNQDIYLINNLYSSIIYSDILVISLVYFFFTILPTSIISRVKNHKIFESK